MRLRFAFKSFSNEIKRQRRSVGQTWPNFNNIELQWWLRKPSSSLAFKRFRIKVVHRTAPCASCSPANRAAGPGGKHRVSHIRSVTSQCELLVGLHLHRFRARGPSRAQGRPGPNVRGPELQGRPPLPQCQSVTKVTPTSPPGGLGTSPLVVPAPGSLDLLQLHT